MVSHPQASKQHRLKRYHSQTYVNGSKCDLNGRAREAEVRVRWGTAVGGWGVGSGFSLPGWLAASSPSAAFLASGVGIGVVIGWGVLISCQESLHPARWGYLARKGLREALAGKGLVGGLWLEGRGGVGQGALGRGYHWG